VISKCGLLEGQKGGIRTIISEFQDSALECSYVVTVARVLSHACEDSSPRCQ
jgi:hypothetical protein